MLLNGAFLASGFAYDDFFWITILEEKIPFHAAVGFWDVKASELPAFSALWYADADNPGRFFRPLFSLIFTLAFRAAGHNAAIVLHVISIALHVLTSYLVFLIFTRFAKRSSALLAGLLFLICPNHSMTIGWISTATDLLAACFSALAIFLYADHLMRRPEHRTWWELPLSFLAVSTAFLAKESAASTVPVIACLEFCFAGRANSLRMRLLETLSAWRRWIPAVLILLFFLGFYTSAGFGTNNLMYANPWKEPLSFLATSVERLGVLVLGCFSIVPIGLGLFYPSWTWPMAACGLLLFVFLMIRLPLDRPVQFSILALICSLLPQLAVDATERQLYFPLLFGSFLAARVLMLPLQEEGLSLWRWLASLHVLFHGVVLALPLALVYSFSYASSFQLPEERALEAKALADSAGASRIVFLNSPGPFFTFYAPDILRSHGYKNVQFLSGMSGRVWLKRSGANSLTLKTEERGWLSNMFARLARKEPRIKSGDPRMARGFQALIVKAAPGEDDALEVRFDFTDDFFREKTIFLRFDGAFHAVERASGSSDWELLGDTTDPLIDMM